MANRTNKTSSSKHKEQAASTNPTEVLGLHVQATSKLVDIVALQRADLKSLSDRMTYTTNLLALQARYILHLTHTVTSIIASLSPDARAMIARPLRDLQELHMEIRAMSADLETAILNEQGHPRSINRRPATGRKRIAKQT